MSTVTRRPLTSRPIQTPIAISPFKTSARVVSSTAKRARSPEPAGDAGIIQTTVKRARAIPPSPINHVAREEDRKEKDRRKAERDAQKAEFRLKYTRAFPTWVFYFDLDALDPESTSNRDTLEAQVVQLGGVRAL
jgi:regulatory subunit for Cdc7p protein kinase